MKEFVWSVPRPSNSKTKTVFAFGYVSNLFVQKELKNLKRKKATGIDDLPNGMLKDCREEIAKPLTYIINLSLKTATVPKDWKTAQITPVHKSGNVTDANNYRPISILPVVSKILEKAVQHQLMNYLEENNLLTDKQFGYRRKRSTELATTLFIDTIRKAGDKGLLSGAVFIDLSKAFDTLGHDNLLWKLENHGIKGLALKWFANYLFERHQVVKFQNEISDQLPLLCGVPQGSILGPILFLIFFNDFEDCLINCNVIEFADDTVVFVSAKTTEEVQKLLNEDLEGIASYFQANELVINLKKNKTECMLLGTAKRIASGPKKLDIFYNRNKINCTDSYKYLGTCIDQYLNLGTNFDVKLKKATSKLYLLKRLRQLLTPEATVAIYTSIILSALRYNCIVQLNLTSTQKEKLKNFETQADKIMAIKTVSIQNELYRYAIKLVRKCIEGNVCSNFQDYFKVNRHRKTTRNKDILLVLPKVRLEFAKSGFFAMGAKLYNLLPREIRLAEKDFNKKLKYFEV